MVKNTVQILDYTLDQIWGRRAMEMLLEHQKQKRSRLSHQLLEIPGGPKGTRTPVFGVRGRRPRPLDDGTSILSLFMNVIPSLPDALDKSRKRTPQR
jgi:hypothetical protein